MTSPAAAHPAELSPSWVREIETILAARADPAEPRLPETQRLIELVFGAAPGDGPTRGGLAPMERPAAIEYYVWRATHAIP